MRENRVIIFIQSGIRNPYFWVVLSLTCAGFALRIFALGHDPLWVDETISVLAAKGLLTHGIPILPSGEIYLRDPASTYTIAISMKIFGGTEFAARLPSVIFGTLAIPLVYFLGKKVAGRNVGLIAAFLITFSFFEIAWSRQARMYPEYQFFFLLAIFAYLRLKSKTKLGNRIFNVTLLVIGTIGTYFSHDTGKIIFAILLLDLLFTLNLKNNIINVVRYVFLAFSLVYIGAVIFFKNPLLPAWIYSFFTQNRIEIVYWEYPSTFLQNNYTVLWWLAIFGSIIIPLRNWGKGTIITISFWVSMFMISYLGYSLGIGGWWPRYLYFIIPFFLILSSAGIWMAVTVIINELADKLAKALKYFRLNILISSSRNQAFAVCITILILFTGVVPNIGVKLQNLSFIVEPQPDYKDAAQLVKKYMKDQDIVISNRPPLVYYYLGKVDYSGNDAFAIEQDGKSVDLYTGASIIKDQQQLEDIVNNNPRGWVIFNPYMKLVGQDWITQNLYLVGEIPSTLSDDNQVVYIYTWGTLPTYSDDFSTDKWTQDRYSSYGIDRSMQIVHTKYVLYPTIADTETYVKYCFNLQDSTNPTIITVVGQGRDTEHSLTVWASSDNINYQKIIEFGINQETKKADLSNYVKDNQVWIEFRFYRSSSGENMPRILSFSIQSVPIDSNAEIKASH